METLLLFIYLAVSGLAGTKIAELKGRNQLRAFWISGLFGVLGLIYVSTGSAETRAYLHAAS